MKKIYLSGKKGKGKFVLVSDEDFEWLNQYKWFASSNYAARKETQKKLWMHREIWKYHFGEIPKGLFVDHIDRNRLNNSLSNLRLATRQQNSANKSISKTNASGFKGVCKRIQRDKRYPGWEKECWQAQIKKDGKHNQKCFPFTEQGKLQAALWYDRKARELFGEYASLNFIYLTK